MSDPPGRAGAPLGEGFLISVDGAPVAVLPGQTIAAALVTAGRLGWRVTRRGGEQRGLFCGIGVCFDCLVTVNGARSVRACLATARAGDVVVTEHGTCHADLAV
jgi:predicted molibdopterin-dependent oxidoreductase YjgC